MTITSAIFIGANPGLVVDNLWNETDSKGSLVVSTGAAGGTSNPGAAVLAAIRNGMVPLPVQTAGYSTVASAKAPQRRGRGACEMRLRTQSCLSRARPASDGLTASLAVSASQVHVLYDRPPAHAPYGARERAIFDPVPATGSSSTLEVRHVSTCYFDHRGGGPILRPSPQRHLRRAPPWRASRPRDRGPQIRQP
jgi:hypothetical protein